MRQSLWGLLLLALLANAKLVVADEESMGDSSESSQQSQQTTEEGGLFTTTAEIFEEQEPSKPLASCDVFEPFKVLPSDPGHYQIGGAFALHKEDCLELSPASVQDVVAVQWAMAYWNEQKRGAAPEGEEGAKEDSSAKSPTNRPKLGLFAGDSCSRPKEAIAQSLRFLDSVGFHEPSECLVSGTLPAETIRRRTGASKLIGLLAPKDRDSAEAVAQSLQASSVPIGVFSPAAGQAFSDANWQRYITTVPLFGDYIRTLVELLRMMGSDLVSILDYGDNFPPSQKLTEQLRQNGISVSEVVAFEHSLAPSILAASDSQIIVSLVSNQDLSESTLGQSQAIRDMPKLWITLELEMAGTEERAPAKLDFVAKGNEGSDPKLQVVTIRRHQRYLADFNAYFLRVLVSNHEHYSLLNAYVRHVYNCTKGQAKFAGQKPKAICSPEQLEPKRLAQLHRQSPSIESAVYLVYAFARTAERIEANPEQREKCSTASSACFEAIREELLKMSKADLENGANVGRLPPGFSDQLANLRFFQTAEGPIQMAGLGVEALLGEREGRDGGNAYKLVEYRTGLNGEGQPLGTVEKFQMPSKLRHIRSKCPPFRPFCLDKCRLATRRSEEQTFLSSPQQFPIYLAAMFDFQGGTNCDRLRRDNTAAVALPLAFVHSMSTFPQRHSPKSALFSPAMAGQLDIGTVLVDTCSSARTLMEFLVDSERNCYKFTQVERNWTVASGATFGYVFGSDEVGPSQAGVLQAMFSSPSSSPIVAIAGERDGEEKQPSDEDEQRLGGLFGFGPSPMAMAQALAKFLRQMHWSYVNIVLDRSDPTSSSIYKQFEKLSAGICTGEVTLLGDDRHQNGQEEAEGQVLTKKRSPAVHKNGKAENAGAHFGIGTPSANVTLVFSAAKQAAEYMSARLRDEFMGAGTSTNVHVIVGEAHDFHLHDPTNLAQYAGTVSFQAKDVTSPEFQNWIRSITPLTLPEVWYWRHVEENWHCALSRKNIARFHGRMCSGEELLDVNGMGRLTKAGYLARGVDRMLAAIDTAHKKLCPNEKLCEEFVRNGRKSVREILAKAARESADEFEVFQLIPSGGQQGNFEYKLLANFSSPHPTTAKDHGVSKFHFLADYRPFGNGIQPADSTDDAKPSIVSRCRAPFCKCPSGRNDFGLDEESLAKASYIRREPARKFADDSGEDLLLVYENADDPQVQELNGAMERELNDALRIIFLVLSALLCVLALATLSLILIKIYQRKIKGHQSLGILLLIGICGLFASAFLFASTPGSELFCHLRIGLHALAHSLCFGVVIVKAIQLRNAETLALMGASAQQISYWNYWLLLGFIFAVQLVICLKWLLFEPFAWATGSSNQQDGQVPDAVANSDRLLLCSYSSPNFVLAQVYSFLLLLLALVLSAQNRNIKRNYKEAKWLFLTSLSCTLLLCIWAICHVLISPIYLDHMTVLELHLTGTLLLAFIFGPKLYVLLFYEPVVVECVYGGSLNAGDKNVDFFETEWHRENEFSPTLSNRSSNLAGNKIIAEEEDETVASAFQTILRKKTGGSGSKAGSSGGSHSRVDSANKNSNLLGPTATPKMGQKGSGERHQRKGRGGGGGQAPGEPQNV